MEDLVIMYHYVMEPEEWKGVSQSHQVILENKWSGLKSIMKLLSQRTYISKRKTKMYYFI